MKLTMGKVSFRKKGISSISSAVSNPISAPTEKDKSSDATFNRDKAIDEHKDDKV
jgi:hypothetical protein